MINRSIAAAAFAAVIGISYFARAQNTLPDTSTPVAKFWLRMYPLTQYVEIWHISVQVKNVEIAVPKAMKLLEKDGGQITLPMSNFAASHKHKYQQLAYRIAPKSANKIVKGLGGLGEMDSLVKTPTSDPSILKEIQDKLAQLQTETRSNKEALAKMPAISGLVQELTEHLNLVNQVHTEARDRILLNIEIHEPSAAGEKDIH